MSHRASPAPLVIVGTGEPAAAAVDSARVGGYRGRILLVSPLAAMPPRPHAWWRDRRVDVLLGARVAAVDHARRTLVVHGHGDVRFDRLVMDPPDEHAPPG